LAAGDDGGDLAARLAADLSALDAEVAEIDLLISQATTEAQRHEQKRVAASERLAAAQAGGEPASSLVEQASALVGLTRRAAVMEAQVDVLGGKRRILGRFRDGLAAYSESLASVVGPFGRSGSQAGAGTLRTGAHAGSRAVLAAQEELRREIARAMHDGPAQSLSNIVLQAQIVERIVDRDPAAARAEVGQLINMVQRTLDTTKSFIFDVRPMVLDDLGLVPTLRGAARDRGKRTGMSISFDSFGSDRRLPRDLESGLFRLIDDAVAAYITLRPGQIALRLEWADQLEVRIAASPADRGPEDGAGGPPEAGSAPEDRPGPTRHDGRSAGDRARGSSHGPSGDISLDLPPALAQMIAQRRDDETAARAKAKRDREIVLPTAVWQEIRGQAESLGLRPELLEGGSAVQFMVDLVELAPTQAP
jgi:two-component system sensor histidine kinase DegS